MACFEACKMRLLLNMSRYSPAVCKFYQKLTSFDKICKSEENLEVSYLGGYPHHLGHVRTNRISVSIAVLEI